MHILIESLFLVEYCKILFFFIISLHRMGIYHYLRNFLGNIFGTRAI